MGVYQPYRGNAENKLFFKIDKLIGGINTEFSDDTSPDNEFKEIVNFDMDTRGSLHKRLGFGKLDAVSQIFNLFTTLPTIKGKTPEEPNPEQLNDNIVYMKMLQNDNGVFRSLSAFSGDKAYREYQKIHGSQNNTFKLMMITTNLYGNTSTCWLFKVTLPPLNTDDDGNYIDEDTIIINETVTELPIVFKWNKNLMNLEAIEFFDKIYFTGNNKGLVVYDRTNDSFAYNGKGITGKTNAAYKPNAMEIRKVGFNMLGDDPLYWVDFQGLTTNSVQGVYLTTMDNIPTLVLPYGGKFRVNVLYTGEGADFTFGFKEGEKDITFTENKNTTLTKSGLTVYDIVLQGVPTSEVEMKITKTGASIEPYYDYYSVGSPDPEAKAISSLNVGDYGICEMYNRAVYYKGDTIWFSEINRFDYVPNYNYVSLPIEPIDEITKVIFFRNVYIVFTKYRIYKMIGQFGTTDFQVMPVNVAVGCHAPNTIVPIENELYFASPRGLYSLKSSDFRDGIENLRELDTKVKSLTSDMSLYVKELTEPAIRYNGISERAYATRYKDKYMLFFNTAFEEGELTAPFQSDVLVYKYDLKAFVTSKFPIKPTFMFMVDNAIETFCTVKEKEEFTEEEVLLDYDFETGTSNTITDKSGNGLDGTMVNGYLQPGLGLHFDGINDNVKISNVDNSVNLESGFEITLDAKFDQFLDGMRFFDFGQLVASASAGPSSGSLWTAWSNGYRAELIYRTTPNVTTKKSTVAYTLRLHRDGTGRNASQSGTFSLKDANGLTLIGSTAFNFNFGNSKYTDVKTGSFTVAHDSKGNYSKGWTLSVSTKYPTYSTGYDKGPTQYFDETQFGSWSKNFGIRLVGRAEAYDWGCRVYIKPAVHLNKGASLSISARAMYTWVNGQQNSQTIPAISHGGSKSVDVWGSEKTVDVHYSGAPVVGVDAQFNIKATISGTYRENINIDGFNIQLPYVNPYTITNWVNFSMSGTSTITFNRISSPSKREIYMTVYGTNSVKIGANSEYTSGSVIFENILDTLRHTWKIKFTKQTSNYSISLTRDGATVGSGTIATEAVINALRDNCLLGGSNSTGKSPNGGLYYFSWKLNNGTPIVEYNFASGRGSRVIDISGKGRNGNINGPTWLVETGLLFNGTNSYVQLPKLDASIKWSNGFTIEFEAKLDSANQLSKILDMAVSYNTGTAGNQKCSINLGTALNRDVLDFMSTSIDLKTMKVSVNNADLGNRHKWKITVVDNGKGYTLTIYKDNVTVATDLFNYGGVTNITRKSNFIGRSNVQGEGYFKGMIYNMKISINASANPVPVFVGALYEYDTTYDDFGRPMEVVLETKGINLHYPLHIKKLKNIFVKGLGGFTYQDFLCFIKSDGHLVNNPYIYNCYINPDTKEVVYEYEENRELDFNEKISLLGNMRLSKTPLGESTYETRKIVVPAKGKNFSFRFQGESDDSLSIESIGFTVKLGKVKEK